MTAVSANNFLNVSDSITPPVKQSCKDKVWDVAKNIFSGILAAGLLIINPTLFIAGFLVGVVWSDQAKEAIQKIVTVWKKQPWVGSAMVIAAGLLALPPALAACSSLYSVHLGSSM